jgi:hypothetical protein
VSSNKNGLKTLRSGHSTVNGKEIWMPRKVHALHDQLSETIAKSRSLSRFKNERIPVVIENQKVCFIWSIESRLWSSIF